jgi:manganese/zinc/iron transport system permease protein
MSDISFAFPTDPDSLWIMAVGSLVAAACAVVGCFLILRRLAMLGDAISHAVLPGIVVAFLLSETRHVIPMVIGAGILGVATAFFTDLLTRYGKLQTDASIGVTFTWLFAIGVILVSRFTGHIDLDVDCVLYGDIIFAPLDTVVWGGWEMPRTFVLLLVVTLLNAAFIVLGYKQLKLCAFDPALAAALGINVVAWHYVLMAFVSVTTVASFESVGAILVVALLVVPPNTAYLLTDRLSWMIGLAVAIGILSAVGGYWLAAILDGSPAGAMATVAGALFFLTAVFSPTHGALGHVLAQYRAKQEVRLAAARES